MAGENETGSGENNAGGEQQTNSGQQPGNGGSGNDRGFPENTPVAEMNYEQQAAYWKHQSRRHENRNSALGNISAEELASLREDAKKVKDYEAANGTDTEKAVRSAYTEAETKAAEKYQPMLVRAEFRAAVGDRMSPEDLKDLLDDMNLNNFLAADGTVDTAKVTARAAKIAPAKGTQQERKGPTVTVHGSGGNGGSGSGSSAASVSQVMAERRAAREAKQQK